MVETMRSWTRTLVTGNRRRPRGRRLPMLAIVLGIIATESSAVVGQSIEPGLTLVEAREQARIASPDLAAARAAVEQAAAHERQAGAFANPILSYSHEQTAVGGATNAQDILAFEQSLDILGSTSRRVAAARLRRLAAEAEMAAAETMLDLQVTIAFARTLAATRRATIADSAALQFQRATQVSSQRLAAGDVSGYSVRRIRLEAARYAALAAAEHFELRAARLRLSALVRVPTDVQLQPLERTAGLDLVLALPADSLDALLVRNHAELRGARLMADAARADVRLAGRDRWPAPVLSAGFKNERVADGFGSSNGFVLGLSVALPFWNRRSGEVGAFRAEVARLESRSESIRQRLRSELFTAIEGARLSETRVSALDAQLGDEARAALQAAEVAYAEGEITLVEWLDTVQAYQETEATYATIVAEAIIQRASIEPLLGISLIR